jgi:glycosyltransferase involved in cell wall biosynthesis
MSIVALAHHWLVRMRGGERVLEEFCRLFPSAPIHTLVADIAEMTEVIRSHRIITSPLQKLPGGARHYKKLLPLFELAIPRMRVRDGTQLVLSSDASMVKGLQVPQGTQHVCYCHSPPRYLWDLHETYLKGTSGLGAVGRAVFSATVPRAKRFDLQAAANVTHFIANSTFVQRRIRQFYDRESAVIYPPVDVDAFTPHLPREDFHLLVSELVPYKRVDIAVEAFRKTGRRLVIIGDGSEMQSLRRDAPANVEFLGRQPFAVLKRHFETCRTFLYPQIEDFGITAVEAQAAGAPVIAFRAGGALDSVVENETGLFFDRQESASLAEAVVEMEGRSFDPLICRRNAERFRPETFRAKIVAFLHTRTGMNFCAP